jgi:DNA repair protein RecO (recombination protein O)
MLTKDTAICIRCIDYSETSQIVTLFSKQNGRINAIAKGSKRPNSAFDGPIEVFSYGSIVFSDSNKEKMATLTEFQQRAEFCVLSDNLYRLHCCLFAAELLYRLTDDYDPHPELFDSFLRFLQNCTKTKKDTDTLRQLVLFQFSLLKEIGLQPILDACVNCKTSIKHRASSIENQFYFSSSANGLVCKDCEASFPDKIRLSSAAADAISDLKKLGTANEKILNEIKKVLIHHFTEILGSRPKMVKYIP